VDIWKVSRGGNVDFRVSKSNWQEMVANLSTCRVAGNVEKILRSAERLDNKRIQMSNKTQLEWFEEYVSHKTK